MAATQSARRRRPFVPEEETDALGDGTRHASFFRGDDRSRVTSAIGVAGREDGQGTPWAAELSAAGYAREVIVVLDGPMGTELAARGVALPAPGWSAEALTTSPEIIAAIHQEYAQAGAKVHRTNTFRAQPRIYGPGFRALVVSAVRLAKRSGGRVAGSMAPIEDCYRPDLSPSEAAARAGHRAMAMTLAEAGCDLLLCETFPHAGEARIAVEEAVATGTETWAALTAGPDASLMTPREMAAGARGCVRAGARAVLVACTSAERTLAYVEHLAAADLGVPIGAYANAGLRRTR
jgi:S-methylmethionine-dependent homocysteine/selenocysteine methylase